MLLIKCCFYTLFFAFATQIAAHPVIYKGGYVASVMLHPDYSHVQSSYSITSKYALGVNYEAFRTPERNRLTEQQFVYLQSNALLKRFYQQHSQGNIYLNLGGGLESGEAAPIYLAGGQVDWETRTLFFSMQSKTLSSMDALKQQVTSLRFGISPYEADYDEMQAWLIFQAEHQRGDAEYVRISPMMRFFYRTALWELGSDLTGSWLMHFMIHM